MIRPLTKREFEIYMLIVEHAWDRASIAKQLGISVMTVNHHKTQIFLKMGVPNAEHLLIQYHTKEQHP